jgi:hypothetical protein
VLTLAQALVAEVAVLAALDFRSQEPTMVEQQEYLVLLVLQLLMVEVEMVETLRWHQLQLDLATAEELQTMEQARLAEMVL